MLPCSFTIFYHNFCHIWPYLTLNLPSTSINLQAFLVPGSPHLASVSCCLKLAKPGAADVG